MIFISSKRTAALFTYGIQTDARVIKGVFLLCTIPIPVYKPEWELARAKGTVFIREEQFPWKQNGA